MIDGHGDDAYKYGQKIVSNFSSNIYNRHNLSALQNHLYSKFDLIYSYPEPDAHSLTTLLSEKHNIGSDNICVTNGATEAIYLIAQAFRKSKTTIIIPTFSEYEDACQINDHTLFFCEKPGDMNPDSDMVWLCNPNNPNGVVYDINCLEEMVNRYKNTIFVFDQSYGHFTDKQVWDVEQAVNYENVILLHSMTKQYAIPGLRLGYITAHSSLIEFVEKIRMPWSVNTLAIETGKFLLNQTTELSDTCNYLNETKRLQEALSKIRGLTVFPTDTHFFLCKLENGTAASLKLWLIENYGILIRDASNFRGLNECYFRIATQTREENDLLIKAIKEWI